MPAWSRVAVLAALFASGASSLILELVWTRQFALIFGTTEGALSAVLAAYMGGLALGSYGWGKLCRRFSPLRLYGALEAGVAVCAVFLTLGISHLDVLLATYWSALSPFPVTFEVLRFLTAFVLVVIPTTLMGGTLPVLCEVFCTGEELLDRPVGQLYAANLLGAVGGALAAGFVLLPTRGIFQTAFCAALLSLIAAAIGVLASLRKPRSAAAPAPAPAPASPQQPLPQNESAAHLRRGLVLAALGISGCAALLEEVLWFRSLRMVLGSSTYALTIMLLIFLLGLALGSEFIAWAAQHIAHPLRLLAALEALLFVSVFAAVYIYPSLPEFFVRGFSAWGSGNRIFVLQAAVAGLVLLPSTILLGALFPLSTRVLGPSGGGPAAEVGAVYAVLTCGNVLGAGISIAWLEGFGLSGGLLAAAALHLGAAVVLLWAFEMRQKLRFGFSAAMAAGLLLIPSARRQWRPLLTTSGVFQNVSFVGTLFNTPQDFFHSLSSLHLLFYREGVSATVSVYEEPSFDGRRRVSLAIDGKVDASTGEDMPTQVLLAHLPLLLVPHAQQVCVIGWGSGITTGSALRYPVSRVTTMEIEPAVIQAAPLFNDFNYRPLADPRLRLVVDDARAVLLREQQTYDVIISEPSNPWMSGPSKLFTREFLEIGKQRLQPGGVFAQWIHLYGLDTPLLQMFLRTFGSVFPHMLAFQSSEGDLVLVGSSSPLVMDPQQIAQRMQDPKVKADLQRIGVTEPEDILMRFRFGDRELAAFAGSGPLNTDALPALEFQAARALYDNTLLQNTANVEEVFRSLKPYLPAGTAPEPVLTSVAIRALARDDDTAAEMFTQELPSEPASAPARWLKGELAWREKHVEEAKSWWQRGLQADPACWGCAVSLALLEQQQGQFRDAGQALASLSIQPAGAWDTPRDRPRDRPGSVLGTVPGPAADPMVAVLRGINQFYSGNRAASGAEFRRAVEGSQSGGNGGDDDPNDIRDIVSRQMFPVRVLAAFYAAETSAGPEPGDSPAAAQIEQFLDDWRLELLKDPSLENWSRLLSQIEFHGGRTAAGAEQKLDTLVVQQVLNPVVSVIRGIRALQLGQAHEAQAQFADAAAQVHDSPGTRQIADAMDRLQAWQAHP